ncbi:cob(I)yrinic acid a,c-diamide adenosyltransferase [Candidatus Uhrbacteria bacterium]|nr:cob(I)yrinic acid a,c-diamide adenosyltransferase [Candidatus Uhrbacteria bacterium]
MEQGLVMIYWGYGKGKSTAAIGLALRALGQGKRVLFMQFMKGGAEAGWETGEGRMFRWLEQSSPSPQPSPIKGEGVIKNPPPLVGGVRGGEDGAHLEYHIVGKGWVRILGDAKPIEDHEQAAREGLAFAKSQITNNKFQVVILDEILSAVDSMLLSVDDIKDLIRAKPPEVHLLMTGHNEYPELAEMADLVTKMEKVKHPYDKGVLAQKGVDF